MAAIIDKSGSMAGLTTEVISGFNKFLKEQQDLKAGDEPVAYVTLFDTQVTHHAENKPLDKVRPLDSESYQANGMTSLLDAVGFTIKRLEEGTTSSDRVLVMITTDGGENSSHTYNRAQVKSMIEQAKARGWEFVFQGANADGWHDAMSLGIKTYGGYINTHAGIGVQYSTAAANVSAMRSMGATADSLNWSSDTATSKQ